MILLNRTCFGKLDNATAYYPKVSGLEHLPALILTGIIIFLGVQPIWLTRWSERATVQISDRLPINEVIAHTNLKFNQEV